MSLKAKQWLFFALIPYGFWLISSYTYHFIDGANLIIHEAGHILFIFFGQILHFMGGTLVQLAFPLFFALLFYGQKSYFEAYLAFFWLAESMMYMAEYMRDAIVQKLPLVGGGVHDWTFLFDKAGVLKYCEEIGLFFHLFASLMIVTLWVKLYLLLFSKKARREEVARKYHEL